VLGRSHPRCLSQSLSLQFLICWSTVAWEKNSFDGKFPVLYSAARNHNPPVPGWLGAKSLRCGHLKYSASVVMKASMPVPISWC
jgi:hypothetical protein